jgi:hypothetical protein
MISHSRSVASDTRLRRGGLSCVAAAPSRAGPEGAGAGPAGAHGGSGTDCRPGPTSRWGSGAGMQNQKCVQPSASSMRPSQPPHARAKPRASGSPSPVLTTGGFVLRRSIAMTSKDTVAYSVR